MRKFLILVSVLSTILTSCGDPKTRQPLVDASLNDMLYVSGGTYNMGSDKVGQFVHPVTLKSFYIGKDNVDYRKYDWYTEATGKKYIDPVAKKYHDYTRKPNHPVDYINWYQANDYCQYLAKISGLHYDLPTQEQWEYVARNNGKPNWDFPTNNGKQEIGVNFPSYKQLTEHSDGDAFPLPVGSIPCTPQGICGLTGAVNEWMKDAKGNLRVLRGGGANGSPEFANAYGHDAVNPNDTNGGFRCVINSEKPMSELRAIAQEHLK